MIVAATATQLSILCPLSWGRKVARAGIETSVSTRLDFDQDHLRHAHHYGLPSRGWRLPTRTDVVSQTSEVSGLSCSCTWYLFCTTVMVDIAACYWSCVVRIVEPWRLFCSRRFLSYVHMLKDSTTVAGTSSEESAAWQPAGVSKLTDGLGAVHTEPATSTGSCVLGC